MHIPSEIRDTVTCSTPDLHQIGEVFGFQSYPESQSGGSVSGKESVERPRVEVATHWTGCVPFARLCLGVVPVSFLSSPIAEEET